MGFLTDVKCPVFNAERQRTTPERSDYVINIGGMCGLKGNYLLDDFLSRFTSKTINSRLTSVSGWSVRADWHGIAWSDFLDWVKVEEAATHVYFESLGGYITCLRLSDLENPRVLICTHVGDEEIEFDYGGPIRMIVPNLWGYKSCKWLQKIYFLNEYVKGFWEAYGYSDDGEILPGRTLDVNTGERRDITGGEVMDF